jgi:hypothetical protein
LNKISEPKAIMNSRIEAFKQLFGELGMADRVELCDWFWKNHQEVLEYSFAGPAERRLWAHFFPNVSAQLGTDTNTLSGNRKIEGQK